MFYVRVRIALIYVDDIILFVPDQDNNDDAIKELEDDGISLNVEYTVYALLGVEVNTDKKSGNITLTQGGLTKKGMKTVGVLDRYKNTSPEEKRTLVTDADATPFDEPWEYGSVVVILMYFYSILRTNI